MSGRVHMLPQKVISSASNTYVPWASLVLDFAHTNKHLECLRYAVEKKCPEWSSYTERLKELEQSQ
jgi:hypothetical protein